MAETDHVGSLGARHESATLPGRAGVPPVFERLALLTCQCLHATAAVVCLAEDGRQRIEAAVGAKEGWLSGACLRFLQSLAAAAGKAGTPVAAGQSTSHQAGQLSLDRDWGFASCVAAPLRTDSGKAWGALVVVDVRQREWRDEEVDSLTVLARCVAVEVELHRLRLAADERPRANAAHIDEERVAAEGLQQQAMLVHLAHDPIYMWDPQRGVIFWNQGCERLYGYTKEQAVGHRHEELLRTRYPLPRDRIDAELNSEGRWSGELVHTTNSQREVVVSSRVQRISTGGQTVFLQADRDITTLRRIIEQLAVSESRYQNLVSIAPVGVYETDAAGEFLYVNERFCEISGLNAEQTLRGGWLNSVDAADRDRVAAAWQESVRSRGKFLEEFRFQCADGRVNWVLSQSKPLIDSTGIFGGFVGTVTDISANKQVELELRSSRQQLQDFVRHIDIAVEEERRRIAREVHDQLGQALTALKLDVKWVAQQLETNAEDAREKVGRRFKDLLELIDSTVDTVQRISGQLRPEMLESMGLVAAIEVLAEQFEERTGIRCRVNADPQLKVRGQDATQIYRIVQESLTNVLRHAEARRVRIELSKVETTLCVAVRDDGRGIEEADRDSPHAFGMMGMRERARILGGTLVITGAPQQGTIVRLDLPFHPDSSAN